VASCGRGSALALTYAGPRREDVEMTPGMALEDAWI
jgi:hypothetical protein